MITMPFVNIPTNYREQNETNFNLLYTVSYFESNKNKYMNKTYFLVDGYVNTFNCMMKAKIQNSDLIR